MPKIIKSLWRDNLTEEQIQEAERKLQKWLEKCKAESEDKHISGKENEE